MALTKVVARAVPLKSTDELEIKFVPVTINVNAPDPAAAFAGEILLIVGTGLLPATTLKFTRFDWPPPGAGFETATAIEVIEHLAPPRLAAFERVVFAHAKPNTVIITTPNSEYNVRFETLPAGQFRHRDHRFEWTRQQFESWAGEVAQRFGYTVTFRPVGNVDAEVGSPTQMGVFSR